MPWLLFYLTILFSSLQMQADTNASMNLNVNYKYTTKNI